MLGEERGPVSGRLVFDVGNTEPPRSAAAPPSPVLRRLRGS
jgi:hypothetical protein